MTRATAVLGATFGGLLLAVLTLWWIAPAGYTAPHGADRDLPSVASPAGRFAEPTAVCVKNLAHSDRAPTPDASEPARRLDTPEPAEREHAVELTLPPVAISDSGPTGALPGHVPTLGPSASSPTRRGQPGSLAPPRRDDSRDSPDEVSLQRREPGQAGFAAALDSDPLIGALRDSLHESTPQSVMGDGPIAGLLQEYASAVDESGGRLPETAANEWLSRLYSLAQQYPDEPAAPEALFEAARLAERVRPNQAAELYRAAGRHPLVTPRRRVTAMYCASASAEYQRDIVGAFEALNEISPALDELEASGMDCGADRLTVAKRKAAILQHCRLLNVPVPPLPAPDAGKRESDFARDVLALSTDAGPQDEWWNLWLLAEALAGEQRSEDASGIFRRLRDHPGNPWTPAGVAVAEADRQDPQHGDQYVAILESAERELPRSAGWHRLNYAIAEWHLRRGDRGEWLARIEPLIDAADPENRQWARQNSNFYGGLLFETAGVYMGKPFYDPDKAHALYGRLVNELPEHPAAGAAREMLELLERNRSRESAESTQGRYDNEE